MMSMTVQDVMTRGVVVVGRQAGFRDAVELLRTQHVSALPVVDEDDRVVGVVSESDPYLKQVRPPDGLAALSHQRLGQPRSRGLTGRWGWRR